MRTYLQHEAVAEVAGMPGLRVRANTRHAFIQTLVCATTIH